MTKEMQQGLLIGAVGGLLLGVLVGYTVGLSKGMSEAGKLLGSAPLPAMEMPQGAPQGMPPGMPQGMPQGGVNQAEVLQRIEMNQKLVAKDPKLVGAWIQLGNDFFDTHQHQKSIDAYARALELNPRNADVLTDQGVMYRDIGKIDEAIANFKKAGQVDPNHVQSVYNLGVVYANDKRDFPKAIEAYKKVIALAPTSPQANEARGALAMLEKAGKQ
jgi:tetratricopeptide (TPR) repeat protein